MLHNPRDARDYIYNAFRLAEDAGKFEAADDLWALLRPPDVRRPRWNRSARLLTAGGRSHQFKRRTAPQLFLVLDALEAEGWPKDGVTINGNLQATKDAVGNLNKALAALGLSFYHHKTGGLARHVEWDLDS
jgi:hypothetical protein